MCRLAYKYKCIDRDWKKSPLILTHLSLFLIFVIFIIIVLFWLKEGGNIFKRFKYPSIPRVFLPSKKLYYSRAVLQSRKQTRSHRVYFQILTHSCFRVHVWRDHRDKFKKSGSPIARRVSRIFTMSEYT